MLKIGCVNIDTSHPGKFAARMKHAELGMRYTAVFNDGFRTDDEVAAFMELAGIEKRYESLQEMAADVDAAFIHDCNWDKHLDHAMPFVEAGKTVFIDKPIVGSLADCLRLKELVGGGARILGSSSLRYVGERDDIRSALAENQEKIATVYGTAGNDEFNYGVHVVELIHGLLGCGAVSTRFLGRSRSGKHPAEQYLVTWQNGVQAIYQLQTGAAQPFHLLVTTDKKIHHRKIDSSRLYDALLGRISRCLTDGTPMASADELAETTMIMLAGKKSRATGGLDIPLQSLALSDPGFDGDTFERTYAMG